MLALCVILTRFSLIIRYIHAIPDFDCVTCYAIESGIA